MAASLEGSVEDSSTASLNCVDNHSSETFSTSCESMIESLASLAIKDSTSDPIDTVTDHPLEVSSSLLDKYYGKLKQETEETEDFNYVVEVFDFNPILKTKDILKELSTYGSEMMRLKWVDDTHALAIYSSSSEARIVCKAPFTKIKVRLLSESTHEESLIMARKVAESMRDSLCKLDMKPNKRPPASASVARRMIGHALGVRINVTPEQREKESRQWKEAKDRKQQRKRQDSVQ